MKPRRATRLVALIAGLGVLAAGCGGSRSSGSGHGGKGEVTVFAASSLSSSFVQVGRVFERSHPNLRVTFNFLSSSDLAAQIEQGAPADVFASADTDSMARIVAAGLADGKARVFAHNRLVILVSKGNPRGIQGLSDLEDDDLIVSLCNAECPAGKYARRVFKRAGVQVTPDSEEIDVAAVVTRVATGQADAGIGYASDAVAAKGRVDEVGIPTSDNVVATYPLVLLKDPGEGSAAFTRLVLSVRGQRILARHGFLPA